MYISVDVGGTNTRIAGANNIEFPMFVGEPIRGSTVYDFAADMKFISQAAIEIAAGEQIDGLGIGTAGDPNDDRSGIKRAFNLSSWTNKPLVATLTRQLKCPVFYDNDAIAAALGETYYGDTKDNFDYVVWGSGIGGASVNWQGSDAVIDMLEYEDNFQKWDDECGGTCIREKYGKSAENLTEEEWLTVLKDFKSNLHSFSDQRKTKVIMFGGGLAARHAEQIYTIGNELNLEVSVSRFADNFGLFGGFGLIKRGHTTLPSS